MAKTKDAVIDPQTPTRVLVHRAISVGGVAHRPIVDGKKRTPVEAVIPHERAVAHGGLIAGGDVEILGPAETVPAPAENRADTPADKQFTGAADKGG